MVRRYNKITIQKSNVHSNIIHISWYKRRIYHTHKDRLRQAAIYRHVGWKNNDMADMDATVHAWHRSGKQRANNKIVAYIGY